MMALEFFSLGSYSASLLNYSRIEMIRHVQELPSESDLQRHVPP